MGIKKESQITKKSVRNGGRVLHLFFFRIPQHFSLVRVKVGTKKRYDNDGCKMVFQPTNAKYACVHAFLDKAYTFFCVKLFPRFHIWPPAVQLVIFHGRGKEKGEKR